MRDQSITMAKFTVGQRVIMLSSSNDGVPYRVHGTVVSVSPYDIGVSWDRMHGRQTGHDCNVPGVTMGWWVSPSVIEPVPQEPEDDLYV